MVRNWEPDETLICERCPSRTCSKEHVDSQLAREDIAELAVQCALRLSRTEDEGCPSLRVIRVCVDGGLKQRPKVNYDAIIGGPKTRARLGTVNSADWSSLLAPFGVVRESDPNDWRLLRPVGGAVLEPLKYERISKLN